MTEYDGNGTFREYRLYIIEALKTHETRLNKLEKMLWGAIIGILAILGDLVITFVMEKLS